VIGWGSIESNHGRQAGSPKENRMSIKLMAGRKTAEVPEDIRWAACPESKKVFRGIDQILIKIPSSARWYKFGP
jgi:hypothetical protein